MSDLKLIIAQAVGEAQARNLNALIAVTDRVGNVLAVYKMAGAPKTSHIPSPPSGVNTDLQGADVPSALAAISKAVTGAYLSSGGNAFSTRTASEIVQQHFPPSPGALGLESGPLFGVQFSQLPCSDLSSRYNPSTLTMIGPKRAPLGLAADPGGLPLYKNGVNVGAIGVEADGVYAFDPDVTQTGGSDDEELIAVAGSVGYAAPAAIRADQISLAGTTLRYLDQDVDALKSTPASATSFDALPASVGALVTVKGYFGETGPQVLAGAVYGAEGSGVRAARTAEYANSDIYVLTDGSGNNRYPVQPGQDGAEVAQPLTTTEVTALLNQAFSVMSSARAAIREPLNTRAQVTISVTDTYGDILGLVLAPDATLFGVDVSVQKARSVAFLSGLHAASDLQGATHDPALSDGGANSAIAAFVDQMRAFLGLPTALTGSTAYAERSIGDLSRPFFPDGQDGRPNGPLSYSIAHWSPFATGLQTALIAENVVQGIGYSTGGAAADTPQRCTFLPNVSGSAKNRLQNGLQIFPGGVPIYRGSTLVGAIGVSGDGVDQDDLIAFLGAAQAASQVGGIANAPTAIRADQIVVPNSGGVQLRYVSCPVSPYLASDAQNVCAGK